MGVERVTASFLLLGEGSAALVEVGPFTCRESLAGAPSATNWREEWVSSWTGCCGASKDLRPELGPKWNNAGQP